MSVSVRDAIVSSSHLASSAPELSEVEFGLIIASHAFNRWMVRCMACAGLPELTSLDILVLNHVGHFFGKPLHELRRDLHARRAGAEGDIEMVLARQAAIGFAPAERFTHNAAHGCLGKRFVTDIVRHARALHPR